MKLYRVILVALVMIVGAAAANTVQAQFRFGIKAGVNVSKLSFDKSVGDNLFKKDNQTGFTGGVMAEFTVPVIGIGGDISAMYVRRNAQYMTENNIKTDHRDYFEIPINIKYKIGIPAVGNLITPYIFTGPSFAFLTSRRAVTDAFKNKAVDTTWNLGLGLQLVNHLQVSASYGFGIGKQFKMPQGGDVDVRNNFWTVTAAYLF